MLTQNEICEKVNIPPYTIDYLVKIRAVPVIQNGKGVPRLFPYEALKIIKKRQERMRVNDGS
ncbi:MAG: hypothetical protein ACTSWK_14065 [Promethearchaeota archaeon]